MNYRERVGRIEPGATLDEALLHAVVLGIATGAGSEPEDELDRIYEVANSRYERQLLETAYREGLALDASQPAPDQLDGGPLAEVFSAFGHDIATLFDDTEDASVAIGVPSALTDTPVDASGPPGSQAPTLPSFLYGTFRRR